jgi:hypothetical protein
MGQIAFKRVPHARDHAEIFRLAIAAVQPGEDANDLGVALRAQQCVVGSGTHRPAMPATER